MARDTRKTLKREKNEKRKVKEKFNNVRRIIKLLTFLWKKTYFGQKHNLGKCSLSYYISSEALFNAVVYLK